MTVADLLAGALRSARVARVFASVDADLVLLEAARRAGLRIVVVRSPASACVMAAVTGMLGDVPGAAVVARADPEVTRALAQALRDRAPAVVVATDSGARMGFAGLQRGAGGVGDGEAKISVVADATTTSREVTHAVRAATDDPPGPVWLALESGVAAQPAGSADATQAARAGGADPTGELRPVAVCIDPRQLDAVAERLAASTRPLIVAGRECRTPGSAGWLRAFAEALPAPVLVTPAARGALPDPHPLAFGLLRADAAVLARADLVVALGVDPIELQAAGVTLGGSVLRLGRGAGGPAAVLTAGDGHATVAAEGDVPVLLEELAPRLRDRVRADWDVAELDRLRRAIAAPAVEPALAALVRRVRDATPAGTAAVFSRALEPLSALWQAVGPGELIVADPVVPAAIAVALARPDAATVVFARGDRALLAELGTARDVHARVILLVVDGPEATCETGAGLARPPSLPALMATLGGALDARAPAVIVVPATGRV
jgi:acetolactate synthase-1/2/3 large subunit